MRLLRLSCHVTAAIALLGALLTVPRTSAAAPGDWERIALQEVQTEARREVVAVGEGGAFRTLQLRVARSPLLVSSLLLRFGDGTSQEIALAQELPAGASSRLIELEGGARVIREIEVVHGGVEPTRRPARLAVWGMR